MIAYHHVRGDHRCSSIMQRIHTQVVEYPALGLTDREFVEVWACTYDGDIIIDNNEVCQMADYYVRKDFISAFAVCVHSTLNLPIP